ncbi:MAG: DUF4406 domain-containing protein [Actinomycetota bacterium]
MLLYIAGPMRGYPDWNYPAFFAAEEVLRSLGHATLNPARNDADTLPEAIAAAGSQDSPTKPWAHYMAKDLPQVMAADGLCVLPGWQRSQGARLETHVAKALGIPLYCLVREGGQHRLVPRLRLIGVSGYARAGKDTIGHLLAGHGYRRVAFADVLREALARLNPKLHEDWGEPVDARVRRPRTVRVADAVAAHGVEGTKTHTLFGAEYVALLQRLGTEVGRQMLGEDVWVNAALDPLPDGGRYVVTDCRFPNEAAAVKAAGGQMWRVERPGVGPRNDHPSETALDDWAFDCVLPNEGTVQDLAGKVAGVVPM